MVYHRRTYGTSAVPAGRVVPVGSARWPCLACAMKPSTFRYRLCIWVYRNLRVRDFVQLLMAATAGWLRVAGAGGRPVPSLVNNLFYLYIGLLECSFIATLHANAGAPATGYRGRSCGVSSIVSTERSSRGDHRTRFTLFRAERRSFGRARSSRGAGITREDTTPSHWLPAHGLTSGEARGSPEAHGTRGKRSCVRHYRSFQAGSSSSITMRIRSGFGSPSLPA